MHDDWKPGDLALCVNEHGWWDFGPHGEMLPAPGPAPGAVHEVAGVSMQRPPPGFGLIIDDELYFEIQSLKFAPWGDLEFGPAGRSFRKIDPLTEEELREAQRELDEDRIAREPVPVFTRPRENV